MEKLPGGKDLGTRAVSCGFVSCAVKLRTKSSMHQEQNHEPELCCENFISAGYGGP